MWSTINNVLPQSFVEGSSFVTGQNLLFISMRNGNWSMTNKVIQYDPSLGDTNGWTELRSKYNNCNAKASVLYELSYMLKNTI